ncbi:MAG: hypothetical protein PCFJNLEI_02749 [Verrucomicrobiae bacterium]|nr:hypothetical protein [Verrucomicrobiae bacterium]
MLTGPAFESQAGRLYFGDRTGVHVLDGSTWSYQHLYERNLREKRYYDDLKCFNTPEFTEDDQGRVYVWSGWGRFGWTGTIGYFIHDGRTWRQETGKAPAEFERINSIIPLEKGRVLVCTADGPTFINTAPDAGGDSVEIVKAEIKRLGHAEFAHREIAQRQLEAWGVRILPVLEEALHDQTDPEIKIRLEEIVTRLTAQRERGPLVGGRRIKSARMFGCDAAGNALIWADWVDETRTSMWFVGRDGSVIKPAEAIRDWYPDSTFLDSQGRLWLARYDRGVVVVAGEKFIPITDETESSFRYVLGEDRQGRVYLSNERLVVAYDFTAPEERAGLPTTFYELSAGNLTACLSSTGEMWAKLKGEAYPFLSVFRDKRWQDATLTGEPVAFERLTFLMPLKNGRLIAQAEMGQSAFFFDGEQWTSYPNLRELIERRAVEVGTQLENRTTGVDFYVKLRVDSQTNIWVTEWTKCGVFTGQRWLEVADHIHGKGLRLDIINHCLPGTDRRHMILGDNYFSYRVAVGVEQVQAEVLDFHWPPVGSGKMAHAWVDSRQRIWVPLDETRAGLIQTGQVAVLSGSGIPRLEDKDGAIWFLNLKTQKLVVEAHDGTRAELAEDALLENSRLVEDRGGSIWVTTKRGLLHVRKQRTGARITLERVALYERHVPRGECWGLWLDRDRNLWFLGHGADRNGLFRVELPAESMSVPK